MACSSWLVNGGRRASRSTTRPPNELSPRRSGATMAAPKRSPSALQSRSGGVVRGQEDGRQRALDADRRAER